MLYPQIRWRREQPATSSAERRPRRGGWRAFAALLGAAVILVGAPTAYAGVTRIGINGARHSELIQGASQTQGGWLNYANTVGANWLPGTTAVPLDYPAQLGSLWGAGALTGDQSVAIGQQNLHALILAELAKGQTVAVAGGSMGTLVIDREIAYLESLSEPPPAGSITFYIFGGESRGFGMTYAPGIKLPIIGVTLDPVPETRYDTVVVFSQWDGWANTPDRPWNVAAVLNALMGVFLQIDGTNDHSNATNASLEDAVLVSETTNSLGGKTTTYMIPTTDLPITRPLRLLGVPKPLVDRINSLLLPLIARGYSSMTPGIAPYFSNGRLVWRSPAAEVVPTALQTDPSASTHSETGTDSEKLASPPTGIDAVLQDRDVQETVDELADDNDGEPQVLTESEFIEPEVAPPADVTDGGSDDDREPAYLEIEPKYPPARDEEQDLESSESSEPDVEAGRSNVDVDRSSSSPTAADDDENSSDSASSEPAAA